MEIASVAKVSAAHGFGLSKIELSTYVTDVVKAKWNDTDKVGDYLRKHCRFINKCPSHDWIEKFMKDYHLSLCCCMLLTCFE
jgi:hypothetical protein